MVLSDIPVFREITQNKGVYFPHDDVEAMAAAIDDSPLVEQRTRALDRVWKKACSCLQFPEPGGAIGGLVQDVGVVRAAVCETGGNSR